jgi:hypothetical protein
LTTKCSVHRANALKMLYKQEGNRLSLDFFWRVR